MATQTNYLGSTLPSQRKANAILGMDPLTLSTGLGWFSIGLGIAEFIAPKAVGRLAGLSNNTNLIRGFGLREIATGIGILSRPEQPALMWARVAGDLLDLTSLGAGLTSSENSRGRTFGALAIVAGVTALDVLCAQQLSGDEAAAPAKASITINCAPDECYRVWRQLENLPEFFTYLETVDQTSHTRSHWVATVPGGPLVQWDAEITEDIPNRRIAWRTVEGSDVYHAGSADFDVAAGGRGTIMRLVTDYGQAAQTLTALAKLAGKDPEQLMQKALRRFKQLLETGEIISTEGQSTGRRDETTWLDNLAK